MAQELAGMAPLVVSTLKRFVNEEIARWRPIIKEIGFKLE